jgi:hypothetical protein
MVCRSSFFRSMPSLRSRFLTARSISSYGAPPLRPLLSRHAAFILPSALSAKVSMESEPAQRGDLSEVSMHEAFDLNIRASAASLAAWLNQLRAECYVAPSKEHIRTRQQAYQFGGALQGSSYWPSMARRTRTQPLTCWQVSTGQPAQQCKCWRSRRSYGRQMVSSARKRVWYQIS